MNLSPDAEVLLDQLRAALEAAPTERRHFGIPVLSGQVVIIHKGLPRGSVMPSGAAFDQLVQAGLLAKVQPLDQRDQRYEITQAGHDHVQPSSWRGRSRRITDHIHSAGRLVLGVVIGVVSTVIGGLALLWITRAWS
jgi:hypothetical protein